MELKYDLGIVMFCELCTMTPSVFVKCLGEQEVEWQVGQPWVVARGCELLLSRSSSAVENLGPSCVRPKGGRSCLDFIEYKLIESLNSIIITKSVYLTKVT